MHGTSAQACTAAPPLRRASGPGGRLGGGPVESSGPAGARGGGPAGGARAGRALRGLRRQAGRRPGRKQRADREPGGGQTGGRRTRGSGTKSAPSGSCTLVSVDCTCQTPSHGSGKTRSAGPPPSCSHARSKAAGTSHAARPAPASPRARSSSTLPQICLPGPSQRRACSKNSEVSRRPGSAGCAWDRRVTRVRMPSPPAPHQARLSSRTCAAATAGHARATEPLPQPVRIPCAAGSSARGPAGEPHASSRGRPQSR